MAFTPIITLQHCTDSIQPSLYFHFFDNIPLRYSLIYLNIRTLENIYFPYGIVEDIILHGSKEL